MDPTRNANGRSLKEIGVYFFRLGLTGFGGPLALVAQMERDLANRWLPGSSFAQVFTAIKTLPGPIAFQMSVFLGHQAAKDGRRFWGGLLAGSTLILPSAVIMVAIAATRAAWSQWTWVSAFVVGLQAAALGLIAASVIPLSRAAVANDRYQSIAKAMFAIFGFAVTLVRPSLEPLAIIVAGLLSMAPIRNRLFSAPAAVTAVAAGMIGWGWWDIHNTLFFTCLKAGGLVFGSGLAIVPLLGSEFVDRLGWISQNEFLEALMLGQVTPGPMVITATYIGYRVSGLSGAFVATVGVFLLPFVHMTTWFPRLWERVSRSEQWRRFSFGAISAVAGAVAASVLKLLEPAVLTAMEMETIKIDRNLVTLLLWFTLVPMGFWFSYYKRTPPWAIVLGGGLISLFALIGF